MGVSWGARMEGSRLSQAVLTSGSSVGVRERMALKKAPGFLEGAHV